MKTIVLVAVLAGRMVLPLVAHGGDRPLVAVVADNAGTEVTDFIVPYAVLTESGAAEVVDVGVRDGTVQLMPALTLAPRETIASFDRLHPEGADYVIVPAMHRADEPLLLAWLRAQAARGATIVGVCDGVWVLANAGLLEDRRATGHWYSLAALARKFPRTRWVRNRRFVRDQNVVTTTGVTASLPMSLALVEELAGSERAAAVAHELGVEQWSDAHDSDRYRLDGRQLRTAAVNWLAFWRWEKLGIPLAAGIDEIKLGFVADAYGRTYRSSAATVGNRPIVTRRGLTIVPDVTDGSVVDRLVPVPTDAAPARSLDCVLATIGTLHGPATARFVALQLEYPWND